MPTPTPALIAAWRQSFEHCVSTMLPRVLGHDWEASLQDRWVRAVRRKDGIELSTELHPGIYIIKPAAAATRVTRELAKMAGSRQ